MFTGLIEEVGTVAAVDAFARGSRIRIAAEVVLEGARPGDSIAIDGACTTVVELQNEPERSFVIEASPETLSKTTFNTFKPGIKVNLERPLLPASRIGGHFVSGHVDGTATVVERRQEGNSQVFHFRLNNPELARYFVEKGSVAVSGISLTVNQVLDDTFTVAIIPYTLAHTNLDQLQIGDTVNIETDLLGKYVARLLGVGAIQDKPEQPRELAYSMQEAGAKVRPKPTRIFAGGWFNTDAAIHGPDSR